MSSTLCLHYLFDLSEQPYEVDIILSLGFRAFEEMFNVTNTRERQIETRFTSVSLAKIRKLDNAICRQAWGHGNPCVLPESDVLGQPFLREICKYLIKLNVCMP